MTPPPVQANPTGYSTSDSVADYPENQTSLSQRAPVSLAFVSGYTLASATQLIQSSLFGFVNPPATVPKNEWSQIPDKISHGKIDIEYLPLVPLNPPSDYIYYALGDVTFRVGPDAWIDGSLKVGKNGTLQSGKLNINGFFGFTLGSVQVTKMDGHHPDHLDFRIDYFRAQNGRLFIKPAGTASIMPAFIWNRLSWSDKFGKMNDEGEIDITHWLATTTGMGGIPFQISQLIDKFINRKPQKSTDPKGKMARWFGGVWTEALQHARVKAEFLFDEPLYKNKDTAVVLKDLVVTYNGSEDITIETGEVSLNNLSDGSRVVVLGTQIHLAETGFKDGVNLSGKGEITNREVLFTRQASGGREEVMARLGDPEVIPELRQPNTIAFDFEGGPFGVDMDVHDIHLQNLESSHPDALISGGLRSDKKNWLKIHIGGDTAEITDGSLGLRMTVDDFFFSDTYHVKNTVCRLDADHPYVGAAPLLDYSIPFSLQCPTASVTRYATGANEIELGGDNAQFEGRVYSGVTRPLTPSRPFDSAQGRQGRGNLASLPLDGGGSGRGWSKNAMVVHVDKGSMELNGRGAILDISIKSDTLGKPVDIENLDIVFNPDGTSQIDVEKMEWVLRTFLQSKVFSYLSEPIGKAGVVKMRATLDERGILIIESQDATSKNHPVFFEGKAKTTLTLAHGVAFKSAHAHLKLRQIRFDSQTQTAELWGHLHSQSEIKMNDALVLLEGLQGDPENVAAQARVFDHEGNDQLYTVDILSTRMVANQNGITLKNNSLKIHSRKAPGEIPIPPPTPVTKLDFEPPKTTTVPNNNPANPADSMGSTIFIQAFARAVKRVDGDFQIPHLKSTLGFSLSQMANNWSNRKLGFDIVPFSVNVLVDFPNGALMARIHTQPDPQTNEEKITAIDIRPQQDPYYPVTFQIGCIPLNLGALGVGIKSISFVPDKPISEDEGIPILTPLIGFFTGEWPKDPPGSLILEVRHGPDFDLAEFVMKELGIKKEHLDKFGIKIDGDKILIPTSFYDFRRLLVEASQGGSGIWGKPERDETAEEDKPVMIGQPDFDWDRAAFRLDLGLVESFGDSQRIRDANDLPPEANPYPIEAGVLRLDPAEGALLQLRKSADHREFVLHPIGFDRLMFDIAELNRPRGGGLLRHLEYALKNQSYIRGGRAHISESRLSLFGRGLHFATEIEFEGIGEKTEPEFKFSGVEGFFDRLKINDLFYDRQSRYWHGNWGGENSSPATFGSNQLTLNGDFHIRGEDPERAEASRRVDFTGQNIRFTSLEASYFPGLQAYHVDEISTDLLHLFHPHVAIEGFRNSRLTNVTVAFSQPRLGTYGRVDPVPDVYFTADSFEKDGGFLFLKTGEKISLGQHSTTGKLTARVEEGQIRFKVSDADIAIRDIPLPFVTQLNLPEGLKLNEVSLNNIHFKGDLQGHFVDRDIILEGDFAISAAGMADLEFKNELSYKSKINLNLSHVRRLVIRDGKLTQIEFDDLEIELDDLNAKIALAEYFYALIAPVKTRDKRKVLVPRGSIRIKRGTINQEKKGTNEPFVQFHGFAFEAELHARDAMVSQIDVPRAEVRIDSNMTMEIIQPTSAQTYDIRLVDYGSIVEIDLPSVKTGK